ncbi:hypothetical protein M9Y10_037251 [Tritrichomonas musculus]|uniref:Uncharacterized protein n=1 Tax=Tritrichomonas musculus TaxID=1915356 RepID=A0ABR2GS40_9EUKA
MNFGSFVAAKVESDYILCDVQGVLDNQNIIADATLADPSINEVIPMPMRHDVVFSLSIRRSRFSSRISTSV